MHTLNLDIKTLTPIGNFVNINPQNIAVYKGYIYFIDVKKLDTVLSLMKLLMEFNEYSNLTNEKNITEWMKNKHIATTELFEEISYYKMPCVFPENIPSANRFFVNSNLVLNKNNLQINLANLLKENFKNILLFDYFKKNNEEFNSYVSKLLLFFEKKPKSLFAKENSFEFLTSCIFEMDKLKLGEQLSQIDRLNIICSTEKDFYEHFIFEKIITPGEEFYQECLKSGLELSFNINYCSDNLFCLMIEKYLQIFEYASSLKLQNEGAFLTEPIRVLNKPSSILSINNELPAYELAGSNFSFINHKQIFFLNLDEINKKRLNKLLSLNKAKKIEDEIFYFSASAKNRLKFLNYAQIKIQG